MTDTEMKGLRLLFRDLVLDIWNGCSVDGHGLKDGLMLVGRLLRTTLLLIFVGMHGDVVADVDSES